MKYGTNRYITSSRTFKPLQENETATF